MHQRIVVQVEDRDDTYNSAAADEALENMAGLHKDGRFQPCLKPDSVSGPAVHLRRGTITGHQSRDILETVRNAPGVTCVEWDPLLSPCVGRHRDPVRSWGNWETVRESAGFHLLTEALPETPGRNVYLVMIDTGIQPDDFAGSPPLGGHDYWDRRFDAAGDLGTGPDTAGLILDRALVEPEDRLDYQPLTSPPQSHGSMMCFDASILAPASIVVDLPVIRGGFLLPLLSNVTACYGALSDLIENEWSDLGARIVVNNSWQLKDPAATGSWDYNRLDSIFNQEVTRLAANGVDIVFAAGNCGNRGTCASWGSDTIYGANSHPDVLTVGASNVYGDFLTVSSRGRGWIVRKKPDLCASSYFEGSSINLFGQQNRLIHDGGTSAACAVISGLLAAIRSHPNWATDQMTPSELRALIRQSCEVDGEILYNSDPGLDRHDPNYGYGILNLPKLLEAFAQ